MTEEEIKKQLISTIKLGLEGVNQSCCRPEVTNLDLDNKRVTIEFDLVVIENDNFVGFEGY